MTTSPSHLHTAIRRAVAAADQPRVPILFQGFLSFAKAVKGVLPRESVLKGPQDGVFPKGKLL